MPKKIVIDGKWHLAIYLLIDFDFEHYSICSIIVYDT